MAETGGVGGSYLNVQPADPRLLGNQGHVIQHQKHFRVRNMRSVFVPQHSESEGVLRPARRSLQPAAEEEERRRSRKDPRERPDEVGTLSPLRRQTDQQVDDVSSCRCYSDCDGEAFRCRLPPTPETDNHAPPRRPALTSCRRPLSCFSFTCGTAEVHAGSRQGDGLGEICEQDGFGAAEFDLTSNVLMLEPGEWAGLNPYSLTPPSEL